MISKYSWILFTNILKRLYKKMTEEDDHTLFSFGTIAQTEIMTEQNELCLPYNPFSFDITFKIIKSKPPFESGLEFKIQSGCTSVFGRTKTDVQYVLNAPTISSRHFMIDQMKKIYDLGSTKGTFFWVPHFKPASLEENKIFLMGVTEFTMKEINFDAKKLVLCYTTANITKEKQFSLAKQENPILIGSHKSCHLQLPHLAQFHAAIDIYTMKLHNLAEDEDCDFQNGVWQRLSPKKKQSSGRKLEADDIISTFPYIFQVIY